MDYYELIAGNFQSTIEAITLSVDNLAGPIERASELMVGALLEDRKVVTCGNGGDAALAQLFTSNLLNRFEQDRPALPALALVSDSTAITAISQTSGPADIYCRQLRAIGNPGDILLCLSSNPSTDSLWRTVQVAHERSMAVIALCGSAESRLPSLLRPDDIELRVDASRPPRVLELHTMILNNLCELLDISIFGPYNQD